MKKPINFKKQKHDRKGSTWQKSEALLAAAVS
jgi:hypothetical protein